MRVLVLEDSSHRYSAIRHALIGNAVIHATTARAAMDQLENHEFDLVMLDHDLAPEHYKGGKSDLPTGLAVAEWIAMFKPRIPNVIIHSLNPVGAARMERALKRAKVNVIMGPYCWGEAATKGVTIPELFGLKACKTEE